MLETIVYIICFIILVGFIAYAGYIAYDYLKYKKGLNDNLDISNNILNYNFNYTSTGMSNMDLILDEQGNKIYSLSSNLNIANSNIIYNSNILLSRINNNSNLFMNTLNSFDRNLNKFFEFDDNNVNISSLANTPNNKIFNYIFGGNVQEKLKLIASTTVHSGLTIMSDVNKELSICNSNFPTKCVKMITDADGNFNITPTNQAGTISINGIDQNIFAQFDMKNKNIYLGGSNENASLYVKNNDVYVKNLRILNSNNQNIYDYNQNLNEPIYTICKITNSKNDDTTFNTTIDISIHFNSYYNITSHKKFFIDIAQYINMNEFSKIIFTSSSSTGNYINIASFKNPDDIISEDLKENINYDDYDGSFFKFKFSELNYINSGYVLNIIYKIKNNTTNVTTLPDTITDFTIITNTYLIKTI
jgi:hypothetical protein